MDLEELEASIVEIESVLQQTRFATLDAVKAFESFSSSIDTVREELDPVINLTQTLMTSQRNINSAVRSMASNLR